MGTANGKMMEFALLAGNRFGFLANHIDKLAAKSSPKLRVVRSSPGNRCRSGQTPLTYHFRKFPSKWHPGKTGPPRRNPGIYGAVAQREAHVIWDHEAAGSSPACSTTRVSQPWHFQFLLGRIGFKRRSVLGAKTRRNERNAVYATGDGVPLPTGKG